MYQLLDTILCSTATKLLCDSIYIEEDENSKVNRTSGKTKFVNDARSLYAFRVGTVVVHVSFSGQISSVEST